MIRTLKGFFQHTDSFMNHQYSTVPISDAGLNRHHYVQTQMKNRLMNEDDNGNRNAYSTLSPS